MKWPDFENFQNLLFKKLLAQSGDQTDIFWEFYLPTDTLWLPKTLQQVLGYTTVVVADFNAGLKSDLQNRSQNGKMHYHRIIKTNCWLMQKENGLL